MLQPLPNPAREAFRILLVEKVPVLGPDLDDVLCRMSYELSQSATLAPLPA
jgi:hypothetical protein